MTHTLLTWPANAIIAVVLGLLALWVIQQLTEK